MNDNLSDLQNWANEDCENLDFEEIENNLEFELERQTNELNGLELDHEKIGSPDSIGETIKNVVWEQFINQLGGKAGEEFIEENRGLTLDLSDDAHIQTTENFEKGDIATHNTKIDYQKRYDDWQFNFQHDENGNVITHPTRTGTQEATLEPGARTPFDQGRPTGSAEKGTDMDHTVSAGEIIRDPAANAHMTKEEQIDFANSEDNLNEMDAAQNRSKKDLPMNDWLDTPNKNGQKPCEIFDISEEQDKKYREKDAEARAEYEKQKKEAEQRSIETGKQSQKEEAVRIGGKALRSLIMGLLASLIKDIIRKLIYWFKSANKKLRTFIDSVKQAIRSFISDIRKHLKNAGNAVATTIATAIFGPVVGLIKKAWMFLKQGYKSVKEAIKFLKDPKNKNMPFSLKMMQVGKIVIAGLTVGGAIVLGEVIEKALLSIPGFGALQIPIHGSLASILGIFLGAVVSGLIGALALNLIDRMISKKLKKINELQQIEKRNEIIDTQNKLLNVVKQKVETTRETSLNNIQKRHNDAANAMAVTIEQIKENSKEIDIPLAENAEIVEDDENEMKSENDNALEQLMLDLNNM